MASDYDPEVPHIQAECSTCHFVFDLKYGTDCPKCHNVGVAWARLVSKQEYEQNYNLYGGVARNALRQRLDAWATEEELRKHFGRPSFRVANFWNDTTEGDKMDVAELYRMYALEDDRTKSEPIG